MKIKDFGNWPEKKQNSDSKISAFKNGYNTCLDEVGGLEVTVDELALAKEIYKHRGGRDWEVNVYKKYPHINPGVFTDKQKCLEDAQRIASTLQQWLVLKGEI